MRLIDAEQEAKWANENLPDAHAGVITQFLRECGTIDPETLPIVRQLREELARVKAERDAAVSDIETAMAYPKDNCRFCKNANCRLKNGTKPCTPKWRGPQKEENQ